MTALKTTLPILRALKDCNLCINLWVNQDKCSLTHIFFHISTERGVCHDYVYYDEHKGRISNSNILTLVHIFAGYSISVYQKKIK